MTRTANAPRLGKGLAALMGHDRREEALSGFRTLSVAAIAPGPFQPRRDFDPGQLAELADSIRRNGVLQPILVRPEPGRDDHYQIIAGERRWRGAKEAGLHEMPCLVRALDDREAMAAALIENLVRQDLNAIEEAEGYRRLLEEFSLGQEQLGEAVGKSRSHVSNTMRLLQLPDPVKHELRQGTLTAGHARALLAHADPAAGARLVLAQGLTVRQTEALAQQAASAGARRAKAGTPEAPDAQIAVFAGELSRRLGVPVDIKAAGNAGQIILRYRNLAQLDGLLGRLTARP